MSNAGGFTRVAAFSVIIPVRDAERQIALCLGALQQSSVQPAEVLVVDDGSLDASGDVAQRFGASVMRLPASRGPGAARNAGAKAAQQPVIMFLDADVMVHRDTIELADHALHNDSRVGALFGAYDDAPLEPGLVSQYRNLLHHYTHSTAVRNAWTFWAGCGAIRRELFLDCGGFDERYRQPSVEDIELGIRLSQAGVRIEVIPHIQVCHMKKWTLLSMIRTDILQRAWPWSRLLLRSRNLPDDLNLGWSQRASAVFAWLAVGLTAAGFLRGPAFFAAVVAVSAVAFLNRPLLGFLARSRGFLFALGAFPLHFLYLLYSSATFAVAAAVYLLQLARAPRRLEARV
jgi:glycosyltransferase involved in cell wall biosynthesis